MNKLIFTLATIAFLATGFTASAQHKHHAHAHQNHHTWTKLGSRVVNYKLDRDVIHVGAKDGGFTKLKVVVTGGAVNMHKMVVEYMNGTKETITLKHSFSKNSTSRTIDIRGGKRLIKDITMYYDTKNLAHSKAVVTITGRH